MVAEYLATCPALRGNKIVMVTEKKRKTQRFTKVAKKALMSTSIANEFSEVGLNTHAGRLADLHRKYN